MIEVVIALAVTIWSVGGALDLHCARVRCGVLWPPMSVTTLACLGPLVWAFRLVAAAHRSRGYPP